MYKELNLIYSKGNAALLILNWRWQQPKEQQSNLKHKDFS